MKKMEFVRYINNNYLRIVSENPDELWRYRFRILERNTISGLLPMDIRAIDGKSYLYYHITSRQSMDALFALRKISALWMESFIAALNLLLDRLEEYLLPCEGLKLEPACIYQDMDTEEFYFIYQPYGEEESEQLISLSVYMIEHVDPENEKLVMQVCRLYEEVSGIGAGCTIKDFILRWEKIRQKESLEEHKQLKIQDVSLKDKDVTEIEYTQTDVQQLKVNEDTAYCDEECRKRSAGSGWNGFKNRWGRKSEKEKIFREEYKSRLKSELEKEYPQTDVKSEDVKQNVFTLEKMDTETEEDRFGKTIYIEENEFWEERKLYGEGVYNRRIIELDKLPFVIGKKKDTVTYLLQDASISRMHVRFTEEKGVLYIEDLNSTNGTYRNGIRLNPYERAPIQKEDEIRLGKMEFTYR